MTLKEISKVLHYLHEKNLTKREQQLFMDLIDVSIRKDTVSFAVTSPARFLKSNNIFYIENKNASKIIKSLIDKQVLIKENTTISLALKRNSNVI